MSDTITLLVEKLARSLSGSGLRLVTAESCTGGWIAKICTDLAGSSQWFDRGFVTYSNEAKQEMLGVQLATLAEHGAVSGAVVAEMVAGAIGKSHADVAVAISGIAGPSGGSPQKPVGTVWVAWQRKGDDPVIKPFLFEGGRDRVRRQSVVVALEGVFALV